MKGPDCIDGQEGVPMVEFDLLRRVQSYCTPEVN